MSNVIYKYPLPSSPGDYKIEMPCNARILGVGDQGDNLVLWAIVDPSKEHEVRVLNVRWTGRDPVDDLVDATYIGTAQVGPFVCHVLERKHV